MGKHTYLCLCVVCAYVNALFTEGQKRVLALLELGVADCFESPEGDAGDQTWDLCKGSASCQRQSYLSSPCYYHFKDLGLKTWESK